jgi:hypothetical protein
MKARIAICAAGAVALAAVFPYAFGQMLGVVLCLQAGGAWGLYALVGVLT